MIRICSVLAILALAGSPAFAAENAPELDLNLNALQPVDGACRVTFLATNHLGAALDKSTVELAIFGKDGAIDRMVLLDFKGLTVGKTKVVQFDLKEIDCTTVSRVLVNDVPACEGQGIATGQCLATLKTSTTTGLIFGL
jgi:hypothetical protein